MTLNYYDIRKTYLILPRLKKKPTEPETFRIYDTTVNNYRGVMRFDGTDYFYIGFPDREETKVKRLKELKALVEQFVKECEEKWIDPRGLDMSFNGIFRAEMALHYIAERFGAKKPNIKSGFDYEFGSQSFNTKVLSISSERCREDETVIFRLFFNDSASARSPKMSSYQDALAWLRTTLSPILIMTGSELLIKGLDGQQDGDIMVDTPIEKLLDIENGFKIESYSLKDKLIKILEHQLKILKVSS